MELAPGILIGMAQVTTPVTLKSRPFRWMEVRVYRHWRIPRKPTLKGLVRRGDVDLVHTGKRPRATFM